MVSRLQDLTGQRFGELVVVGLHHKGAGTPTQWSCRCDCGNLSNVQAPRLKSGKTTSCGCKKIVHGMHGTPTYKSWNMMKQRCLNPKNDNYYKYGGAGVTVCKEWLTFEGFFSDMGERNADDLIQFRINKRLAMDGITCDHPLFAKLGGKAV